MAGMPKNAEFATWDQTNQGSAGGPDECTGASALVRAGQNGRMPPSTYLPHPSAKFTVEEQLQLVHGFLATSR
jgi:hypothetical protein